METNRPNFPEHDQVVAAQLERLTGQRQPPPERDLDPEDHHGAGEVLVVVAGIFGAVVAFGAGIALVLYLIRLALG